MNCVKVFLLVAFISCCFIDVYGQDEDSHIDTIRRAVPANPAQPATPGQPVQTPKPATPKTPTVVEKATIRGSVFDQKNGDPILFTTVYLKGTTLGASTDVNGFFAIAKIPKGTYTIVTTALGYDTATAEVTVVKDNQIITKNLYINKVNVSLGTVDISARKEEKRTQSQVSIIKLTPQMISQLPSVGGEPDIAQYLQVIPGVIFTGDQGGQLYIRGGSPEETKVLLDGLPVYNPFHSIGLYSIFDNDILKSVDVYTGGFNAEYGGRISAVLDVHTTDGNKKLFSGNVMASPFIAKAELDGPLIKQKDNGGSLTYVLSSRNSILDKTSPVLYPYVSGGKLPYAFNDFYGKLAYNSKNGSKISFFGFDNNDRSNIPNVASFTWKQWGVGANYLIVPGNSNIIIDGIVGYSTYGISMLETDNQPRNSSIGGFTVSMNFTYYIKAGELKYGFNIDGYNTAFNFFNEAGTITSQDGQSTELGAFMKFRKVLWKKLVIEPGIRFNYYASLGEISPEPRLDMKYSITDWFRLKFATGLYSQNIISTKADQDVVDLFTGFLLAPNETLTNANGQQTNTKLQKAVHAVFGFEIDIAKNIELNIEPYYKRYLQLINLNRYKEFPTDPDFIVSTGNAYGIDFLLKYNNKNLSVWVSYSLSRVETNDGLEVYTPFYDRTHNLNTVVSYKFGKKKDWETSARWNLGSGFPFTRTQAFYENISFLNGINTNYTTANGSLGVQYESTINAGRLPWYHRLDLSIKKHFQFTKWLGMEITASVTNVYDRDNIFYFDRVTYVRVNQLPIMPSLAVGVSF